MILGRKISSLLETVKLHKRDGCFCEAVGSELHRNGENTQAMNDIASANKYTSAISELKSITLDDRNGVKKEREENVMKSIPIYNNSKSQ